MSQIRENDLEANEKAWQAWVSRNRLEDAATTRSLKIWVTAIIMSAGACVGAYMIFWKA